jgi:hypothetical protein
LVPGIKILIIEIIRIFFHFTFVAPISPFCINPRSQHGRRATAASLKLHSRSRIVI